MGNIQSSSVLPKVRIGEIAIKVGSGATPRGGKESYKADGISLIRSMNVYDLKFYYTDLAFIDENQAKLLDNVTVKKDDVLLNITGASVARCCIVPDRILPARVNQHVAIIRLDKTKANPYFLQYCLVSPLYKEHLLSIAQGGATREALTKEKIEEFCIPFPNLSVQHKIAAILSAYDDLIENNLRRIRILEEMAQNIYREWFVNFRFPGHENARFVDSPLGKIPEGWEVKPLSELIAGHIGGGWGKDEPNGKYIEPAWVIRGTDIPNAKHCDVSRIPFRCHTESNLKTRKLKTGDIIFEVSGGSKGQPLGRTLLISSELLRLFRGYPVICASFCKRIQPSYELFAPEILYLSFIEGYESGEIEQFQVQSTGISNFRWSDYLEKVYRCVPPRLIQDSFREITVPIFSQISILGLKNHFLRQNRDLLLPKLISGEVDVSELDIKVPEEVAI